jgi:N-acetylglucosaminylphosphatidylinositol deacetylase
MSPQDLHVLIVAHPDDESMFFVPTLRALKAANETVWILCLTTGDFDGLGKIRSKEMIRAGTLLGAQRTIVRDELKDDPVNRWDIRQAEKEIEGTLIKEMRTTNRDWKRVILISFDPLGISGHVNHIDTHLGVYGVAQHGKLELSRGGCSIPLEMWSLVSERNIFAKYCPVFCWLLLLLSCFKSAVATTHHERVSYSTYYRTYRLHEPSLNWKAMATHASQFVWYRRLFVVFSCYTYVNRLERIKGSETTQSRFS